jgi:hypothetical protein
MRWSRPEIMNSVRELSRFMQEASKAHLTVMYRVMKYCVGTPKRGLMIEPTEFWDGDKKSNLLSVVDLIQTSQKILLVAEVLVDAQLFFVKHQYPLEARCKIV